MNKRTYNFNKTMFDFYADRKKALKLKARAGRHTFGKEAEEAKQQIADYLKREPTRRDY